MVGYHHCPRFFPLPREINALHIQPTKNMLLRTGNKTTSNMTKSTVSDAWSHFTYWH
jgi:hypothetical protein